MKQSGPTTSDGETAQQINCELSRLFDQQVELTKREAFVGLTPVERQEYDRITAKIRESYVRLAKLGLDR